MRPGGSGVTLTRRSAGKHKNWRPQHSPRILAAIYQFYRYVVILGVYIIRLTMDVFLMIRRKKLTIFTDAKDDTTVLELKKMIEGIMKVPPANQQLFNKDNLLMSDNKTLQDYGLTSATAKAQCPALVGLALRQPDGQFEPLEMTPFSLPPDLPDVMKSQENNGQEQSP